MNYRWLNQNSMSFDQCPADSSEKDQIRREDSFAADSEKKRNFHQTLKQMLIGAFPQRHHLTKRLHHQQLLQTTTGKPNPAIISPDPSSQAASQPGHIGYQCEQQQDTNSLLFAQSIRLKKLSINHRKVAERRRAEVGRGRRGAGREASKSNGKQYLMVT